MLASIGENWAFMSCLTMLFFTSSFSTHHALCQPGDPLRVKSGLHREWSSCSERVWAQSPRPNPVETMMALENAAVRKLQKPSVGCEPPHDLTGLTFLLSMGTGLSFHRPVKKKSLGGNPLRSEDEVTNLSWWDSNLCPGPLRWLKVSSHSPVHQALSIDWINEMA